MNIVPKITDSPNAMPYEYRGGKIEFRNVSYSFNQKKIFDGLNLVIEPGSINAIVGESGIGKSTMFRLLFRLLETD